MKMTLIIIIVLIVAVIAALFLFRKKPATDTNGGAAATPDTSFTSPIFSGGVDAWIRGRSADNWTLV